MCLPLDYLRQAVSSGITHPQIQQLNIFQAGVKNQLAAYGVHSTCYLVKDVGMKCGANRKCANSLTETQKLLADLMFADPACKSQLLHIACDQAICMHTKTCICIPIHAYAYQDMRMHTKTCICIPRHAYAYQDMV